MKTKLLILIFIIAGAILGSQNVYATVGGPTYLYNLRTNETGKEILYETHDMGGKGCPPEISILDAETGETRKLVDCDDPNHAEVYKNTLAKYPISLERVHLPYNQIEARVTIIREVKENPPQEYMPRTDFNLEITQSGKTIASAQYSGCYPTQPHLIEGYVLPKGTLVAFVISSIGDCFEGGYTKEQIIPASGAAITYNYYLEGREKRGPIVADASKDNGNLLVIAEKKDASSPPVSRSTDLPYVIIIGALLLAIILIMALKVRR